MLKAIGNWVVNVYRKTLVRRWYQHVTNRLTTAEARRDPAKTFVNFGYAPLLREAFRPDLDEADEPSRLFIQLYHRVAGAVDLAARDVLEVGCGHGGGACFIKRYYRARSVVGVDLNTRGIEFCRQHFAVEGLSFSRQDAEALEFADGSFDAVVNIESSHCYPSMERFLAQVVRVLRPGGYFLFADMRRKGEKATLEEQLARSGLEIVEREDITRNVALAMELNNELLVQRVRELMPKFLWVLEGVGRRSAGVKRMRVYQAYCRGDMLFLVYTLRKRGVPG